MHRSPGMFLLAFVWACASTVLASAQAVSSSTQIGKSNSSGSAPVAYVYVSNTPSSGKVQINAYAAASNGALSAITGSPFATNVAVMALNGGWLFGVEATGTGAGQIIDSFAIASNGALTLKHQTHVNDSGGGTISLLLDHTGSSLYPDYYTLNNDCLTYSIDQANGALTYHSVVHGGPGTGCATSFTANNQFVYSSSCYHFTSLIYGDKRGSNGSLTVLNINPPMPTPPPNTGFCPFLAAADPHNHVAVAVTPEAGGFGNNEGATQLAVYTADSSGNLTTNSTYKNMPKTAVVPTSGTVASVTDYWMSPAGNLLAVAGPFGLQVFHFNGGNPITHYTGLLVTTQVDQVFWDNANHLYAIARKAGKLYVFTVTPTSVTQAPGSPHSIANPESLMILPKS